MDRAKNRDPVEVAGGAEKEELRKGEDGDGAIFGKTNAHVKIELRGLSQILEEKGRGNAVGGVHQVGTHRDQGKGRGKRENNTGKVFGGGGPNGKGDPDGRIHRNTGEERPEDSHFDITVQNVLRVPTEGHPVLVTIANNDFPLNRVGLWTRAAFYKDFTEAPHEGGGTDNTERRGSDM